MLLSEAFKKKDKDPNRTVSVASLSKPGKPYTKTRWFNHPKDSKEYKDGEARQKRAAEKFGSTWRDK